MNHIGQTIAIAGIRRPCATARVGRSFAQPGGLPDSSRGLSAATPPVMALKQAAPRRGARLGMIYNESHP